jgi:hypothetical protein
LFDCPLTAGEQYNQEKKMNTNLGLKVQQNNYTRLNRTYSAISVTYQLAAKIIE